MSNVARDKRKYAVLEKLGWNIIEVSECELKANKKQGTLEKIEEMLKNAYNLCKPDTDLNTLDNIFKYQTYTSNR